MMLLLISCKRDLLRLERSTLAGQGTVFVDPKAETEFVKQRHPEAAKVFEVERANTGVFVELKDPQGNIVPGVVADYWIDGVPIAGIYDGGAFTDGPLPARVGDPNSGYRERGVAYAEDSYASEVFREPQPVRPA